MSITVTVMYPNTPGSNFDLDYYLTKHKELVGKTMGSSITSMKVIKGLGTPDPEASAPFQIMAIIEFESLEALHIAMTEHSAEVMGDIPNFTDIKPIVQFSENLK